MDLTYFDNYDSMSSAAADLIYAEIIAKPDLLLCGATGSSPLGAYKKLAEKYGANSTPFKRFRLFKLDEWGGVEKDHPQSCETFLLENIVEPFELNAERYISFDSNPADNEAECQKIRTYLQNNGPIDLCILGLGLNGHIAFNEPAPALQVSCHVATLSETSLQHSMATNMSDKPTFGLTLGMGDILQSRKIILLISGSKKQQIVKEFLAKKITTQLPASFLWLHPNITCLVDKQYESNF